MIPGDAISDARSANRVTLDEMLRRAAQEHPDAAALVDLPDPARDAAPRRLSFAQADRIVSAIAARLHRLGLSTDAVIGLQLPNTIDHVLAFLGTLRAGMIAAPLPLLWRRADCVAALSLAGARALITRGAHGGAEHFRIAMQTAAEIFSIRHVCGFGPQVPDGIIPLDDLYEGVSFDPPPPARAHDEVPAAHVAAITWDVTADGLIAVARSHRELAAAGTAVLLESRLPPHPAILSTVEPSSLAGLSAGLLPWLLSGGTLVLHHAFSLDIFAAQVVGHGCDTVVLPGPLAAHLAGTDFLPPGHRVTNLLAVWRAPERLIGTAGWRHPAIAMTDIVALGETAVVAGRREEDGRPLPLPFGPVMVPRGEPGAIRVADLARTSAGTLAAGGPMVPRYPFPPDAERRGRAFLRVAADGMVNTGYPCRAIRETGSLIVTGPPSGLVSVGGYRFAWRELQDLVAGADSGATIAALPDRTMGHRLAGHSPDRAATRDALEAIGANPLIVRAFRERMRRDLP